MATSTYTLLDVVNKVLLNLNERPLADTTTLLGQKVKDSVATALSDIAEAQDWRFLEQKLASTSWSSNVITLPTDIQKVEEVFWNSGSFGDIRIHYLHRDDFDRYPTSSYASGGRPIYWTDIDYNVVKVTPYPSTTVEQGKVFFRVLNRLILPTTDNSTFSMPDQHVLLLIRKTTALMAMRHAEDPALATYYEREYQDSLIQLTTKNAGRHVKHLSAYRDK